MLPVLAVDQMSMSFVHRTSVVGVLAPMETMLYLLHRRLATPYLMTSCFLPSEKTSYSLPPEETRCLLPPEETSCFLPPEETSYSLVIASGPEVAFVTPAISVDRSNMEWFCLRNISS
uniref:Uncharacterized protein n=1 Tax=Tanacetum cinerariifolium TaxID=118510 RepID=A0A699HRY0_TANCI|nr:hypothetical protein [Tanacetum cinerariifolium]